MKMCIIKTNKRNYKNKILQKNIKCCMKTLIKSISKEPKTKAFKRFKLSKVVCYYFGNNCSSA